ncbi:type VII secretion-associated serine protease mycosin [Catenuloplanes atrovinosus]|uniref:Type VII secretion-associated serine protease mycosin n=1 Tax=Catenuloplanes atrovinosus TaxID=137266 RepID=A0AAE3YYK9_9ACTN|nr:type VII secretion-associated serine protease mycosin [Catenuloplanes atrovinosus]MDR7280966.1 type VII secretion-associated serine protease mycosin [Catenuloplanes atrovinosus]
MSLTLPRRLARLTLAALLLAPLALPGTAHAAVACGGPEGEDAPAQRSWALTRLAPETAWPLSRGAGVTVAVIDSGVNGDHPILDGRVLDGRDFGFQNFQGQCDLAGHGTVVAGIIAGRDRVNQSFSGIAPDASILPLRVLDEVGFVDDPSAPGRIAQAIRFAVDQEADVINLSLQTEDTAEMRSAIAYAEERDVVVVAAAGNLQEGQKPENNTIYPAAYDTVLAVAGVDEAGKHVSSSVQGPFVDITAPGFNLYGPAPTGDKFVGEAEGGTSFAAAFVSGAAALVRSYYPDMSAADVRTRLTETADAPPQGRDNAFGFGVVNPYVSLTAVFSSKEPGPAGGITLAGEPADPTATARLVAIWAIAIVLVLAVAMLAGAPLVRRGRRNGWRPDHNNL